MPDDSHEFDRVPSNLPPPRGPSVGVSCRDLSPPVVVMTPPGRQTVWWVMTIVLAMIATALVLRLDDAAFFKSAMAQSADRGPSPMAGARGIYAFTGQLSGKSYGLFMLDVDAGTIWCYELARGRDNEIRLKLVAARSWIFDRYLEEFNVDAPTPSEVREMVQRQASNAGQTPGGTVEPRPAKSVKTPGTRNNP